MSARLDTMSIAELDRYWRANRYGSGLARTLAAYAFSAACALASRQQGKLRDARLYAKRCDYLYYSLPLELRW